MVSAIYYVARSEKDKNNIMSEIRIKTNTFHFLICKYRHKDILLDFKAMRYAVTLPDRTSYRKMIVPVTLDLSTARDSHRRSETRRSPDAIVIITEIHVQEAEYPDSMYLRTNKNVINNKARSEVIARTPARRMTPLAEGVAAGASRRLAGRPVVGRPLETEGIKGGVATARELISRHHSNGSRPLVRVVRYPDSIILCTG